MTHNPPPKFVIFVNDKELMHFSYTRYIENKFREAFGFEGTSLKFIIRERDEDVDRTVSDADGTFRFEGLLPDTYILYAFPDTVDIEAGGCYYFGDLQWNESNMIVVNGDVYDVDITLLVLEQGFGAGEGRIGGAFDFPEGAFKARD